MSDPFGFPPERDLPDAVRAEARRRITASLRADESAGRSRRLAPVVIAASVVLFAVTAMSVVALNSPNRTDLAAARASAAAEQPSRGNRFITPEEMYSVIEGGAPAESVERCAAVARQERGGRPAPEQWQAMLTASARGASVIAFRTSAGPLFCELTPAAVALSVPAAQQPAPGTARPTFISAAGTVAGVIDPGFGTLWAERSAATAGTVTALVRDGIFVIPNGVSVPVAPAGLTLHPGGSPELGGKTTVVPASELPALATSVTDRPQPPGDRESEAGRRVADCFARPDGPPPVDQASWQPGAATVLNSDEIMQVARYGTLLAVCLFDTSSGTDQVRLKVDDGAQSSGYRDLEAVDNPFLLTTTLFYDFRGQLRGGTASSTVAVAGLVKSADVARVSISRPTSPAVAATVENGTFILPAINLNDGTPQQRENTEITVFDASGAVLSRIPMGI